jgi:hypothetical protein
MLIYHSQEIRALRYDQEQDIEFKHSYYWLDIGN